MDAAARRLSLDVNAAVSESMKDIQDYVSYNLQRHYFRCASRCFDARTSPELANNCVEQCVAPLQRANRILNDELSKFQERLTRSVMVCRDRLEISEESIVTPLQDAQMQLCVETSVQEHIKTLPRIAEKIKSQITVNEEY